MANPVKVHDKEACGENFDELANDLSKLIQQKHVKEAITRLEKCKESRLNAAAHHGEMDKRHTPVFILIEQLQSCIEKINTTVKFAEVYGGKTTISYSGTPMKFIIELSVKGGKRIYTINRRGADYKDIPTR